MGDVDLADERTATSDAPPDTGHPFPSPGAALTVDVLVELSEAPGPVHLRQLARSLGVSRSTLHRVLQTLESKGVVEHVRGAGYSLADAILRIGTRYRARQLPRLAEPILQEIHRQTSETVNLAVPDGDSMVIIASVQSNEPLRMTSWVGKRDLLHASALGKSYLAALPDDMLKHTVAALHLTAATPRTFVDRDSLIEDLQRSRTRGFAIDDEESVLGVRCIGAAVRGAAGQPLASLSVSAPTPRLPLAAVESIGALVVHAASSISGLLEGGAHPVDLGMAAASRRLEP